MARAKATIDHKTIKSWVEARGGCPARVKASGSNGDPGIIRIDYTGFSGQHSLEKVSWKAFFDAFERNKLAFLYQDEGESRFSKLVSRSSVAATDGKTAKASSNNGARKSGKKKASARKFPIDAIQLLTQQHREVEEMLEKLEGARSNTQKERIFAKLANAVAAHSKIEEMMFYPAAFGEATEAQLREAVEEHLVAKRLLADMMKMECSDPQFMSKVAVLKEVLTHHIKEEEQVLFKKVRKEGVDDLHVLAESMQQQYRRLLKQQPSRQIPKETQAAAALH